MRPIHDVSCVGLSRTHALPPRDKPQDLDQELLRLYGRFLGGSPVPHSQDMYVHNIYMMCVSTTRTESMGQQGQLLYRITATTHT
jgi:hypothetical protein